jgi:hypothetical protein
LWLALLAGDVTAGVAGVNNAARGLKLRGQRREWLAAAAEGHLGAVRAQSYAVSDLFRIETIQTPL